MASLKMIVIDDTEDIHVSIKILLQQRQSQEKLEFFSQQIFGVQEQDQEQEQPKAEVFEDLIIDSAYQGKEGFEMIKAAYEAGEPYAVAVVDMRMPPGWDGLKTIEAIRKVDTSIEIIICSAYSDYSWQHISDRLGRTSSYLFLSKPFEVVEMKQMVIALGHKWYLDRQNKSYILKLEKAKATTEAALRAKEEFLGVMGHELRTPLNIIIMTLQDFLESETDEENSKLLRNSEESAKYLARLIDNLLYYIALDSQNFKMESSTFKVDQLLHEVMRLMPSSQRESCKVSIQVDENVPEIASDRKKFQVALLQVIDNAMKYSDGTNIEIAVKLDISVPSMPFLALYVRDSGVGMNEQELGQAFDLFYQGESSNHHSKSGTGVGLSLCKKIVESLDGNITLSSKIDGGLEVLIRVPVNHPK